jgi:PPOX class probable F420-dependent enzyme
MSSAAGRRPKDMLPDDVRTLLGAPNIAHLATLLPDGAPHVMPMWVGVEGDRIAFLTSPGSRKARNIARDPRVAISVAAHDRPNVMAHVRGRVVEVVDGDRGWEIIDRMAQRYIGGPYPLREDRVVYLVEPERAFAQAF